MKAWLGYSALRYLGEANHGAYFRAAPPADLGLDGPVLLKILYAGSSDDQWQAFAREIRLLGDLEDPHVVPLLDRGHERGRLHYATEFPVAGTLLEPAEAIDAATAQRALAHGARGLHAVHLAGVVHRDFKPSKVFLSQDGGKLSDLGTADETRMQEGHAVPTGTLGFMAPEIAKGDPASVRSDLFSLGATVHQVLTGQGLYPDLPRQNIVAALGHLATEAPTIARDKLPASIEPVVSACLSQNAKDRPGTALDVARALESLG